VCVVILRCQIQSSAPSADQTRNIIVDVRHSVSSSSDGLVARLAVPDSHRVSLDGCLSAEGADVFGVLRNLHLLYLLSQGGTISVNREIEQSAMRSDFFFKLIRVARTLMALRGEEFAIPPLERARRDSSPLERINHVPCTVLAGNSDLLSSLRHLG
jgi:hypothetical protein